MIDPSALPQPTAAGSQQGLPQPLPLRLETFFDGRLRADGLVFTRSGRLLKSFQVDMHGSWSGDEGMLREDYLYSDGTRERRDWSLTRLPQADGSVRYRGRADDVVGAPEGHVVGNQFRWSYQLVLPLYGRRIAIAMDDTMVLVDERLLLNQTRMRKFGIDLGTVLMTMRKV